MTWAYRSEREPFECGVRNLNSQRYYYGSSTETELDDRITQDESDVYAPTLRLLRETAEGPVTDPRVPRLIAHLEMRNRAVRESFRAPMERLVAQLAARLAQTEEMVRRTVAGVRSDPNKVLGDRASSPDAAFYRARILGLTKAQLSNIIRPIIIEAHRTVEQLFSEVTLHQFLKDSHNKALLSTTAGTARSRAYEALHYHVVDVPPHSPPLVLGDSAVVFKTNRGTYLPLEEHPAEMQEVVLPLGSRRYLRGTRKPHSPLPQVETLREAAARCSREQFIAASRSAENVGLQPVIGSWANLLSEGEADELLDDVLNEALSTGIVRVK